MKWGNVLITKKEVNGNEIKLFGKIDLEDKNFKKTKKITWITADSDVLVEVTIVEFDHLISKKKLEDTEEVKDFVNTSSKAEYQALAEGAMRNLAKGSIIQLERRGFFFVDEI